MVREVDEREIQLLLQEDEDDAKLSGFDILNGLDHKSKRWDEKDDIVYWGMRQLKESAAKIEEKYRHLDPL